MNSFERILATLKGEAVDKKPFTATLSQYGLNYCGASNQEYYQKPDVYVQGQKVIYEKFATDVLFGPFALALIGKAFGAELKFYNDKPPLVKKPMIQSVEELLKYKYPDIHSNPDILYLRNCIKNLSAHFDKTVPVAAITLNPVDLPIMIFGMDKWFDIFLFDKDAFNNTLEYIVPFFVDFCNALIADGAACIIMPTVFANSNFVTREQTLKIVNPILKSAFSKVNGGLVMHHGGLPFMPYLDTFLDFPENVIGFALNWTDCYSDAFKLIKNQRLIFHGIDGPTLYLKQRNEVKNQCLEILNLTRQNNKHVLFTCSSDILCQTPEENISAMSEAIEEFYKP